MSARQCNGPVAVPYEKRNRHLSLIKQYIIQTPSHRYPNNVALLQSGGQGNTDVMWVTDIDNSSTGEWTLSGYTFRKVTKAWGFELRTTMADGAHRVDKEVTSKDIFSYKVSFPRISNSSVPSSNVIGKCMALPLDAAFSPGKQGELPPPTSCFYVTLLHHCTPS